MNPKQRFAKWLAQQLTYAAARVAAWGGSHTTMTVTEPDGTSATREWGTPTPRRSNDAGMRYFADCGDACWERRLHQLLDPACIVYQQRHQS